MEFRHAEQREETERIDEDVPDIRIEIMINEDFLEETRELSPKEYDVTENENEEQLNQQELKRLWDITQRKIP